MYTRTHGTCGSELRLEAHTHTHTHACTHTHIHTHTHAHTCMHTYTCTHTHTCMHTYTRTHAHTRTHTAHLSYAHVTQTTAPGERKGSHTRAHTQTHTHTHNRREVSFVQRVCSILWVTGGVSRTRTQHPLVMRSRCVVSSTSCVKQSPQVREKELLLGVFVFASRSTRPCCTE